MTRGHARPERPACPFPANGSAAERSSPDCPPACADLYRRLSDRLAVPAPPQEQAIARHCPAPLATLTYQACWLERAIALERDCGRSGSWRHDRNRLIALCQLRRIALCLIASASTVHHRGEPNANGRRGDPRRP